MLTPPHPFKTVETAHLFAVLSWIEAQDRTLPPLGYATTKYDEPVFVHASSGSLQCETADIVDLHYQDSRWHLTQNALTLFGPHGPLPMAMTLLGKQCKENGDNAWTDFFDRLQHRFLLAFYRAWASSRPLPGGKDYFGAYIDAFTGNRHASPHLCVDTQRYFAGRLAAQVRNPEGLCALLQDYFGVRVTLQEYRQVCIPLPDHKRSRLKSASCALSQSAMLGRRAITRMHFTLILGPLSLEDYQSFLLDSTALASVNAWVSLYAGNTPWTLQLALDKREMPRMALGKNTRLGQLAWCGGRHGRVANGVKTCRLAMSLSSSSQYEIL